VPKKIDSSSISVCKLEAAMDEESDPSGRIRDGLENIRPMLLVFVDL
jgi:hypothetical protein